MQKVESCSVMIVDDDPVHLEKVGRDLRDAPNIAVVGSYANSTKAADQIGKVKPDVLLTDIEMPGMSGLQLIAATKELSPETRTKI
ncbi:MAG: response regulator [Nitrospinae bacterium]|nr:response regulator [Nitrospinota bacterium]